VSADIRQAILNELRRRETNANWLAAMVSDHVHRSHVYDFIAGKKDLTTERANHLLRALSLTVKARTR
jgi:plasmid maintenance system antidote protein VapI